MHGCKELARLQRVTAPTAAVHVGLGALSYGTDRSGSKVAAIAAASLRVRCAASTSSELLPLPLPQPVPLLLPLPLPLPAPWQSLARRAAAALMECASCTALRCRRPR